MLCPQEKMVEIEEKWKEKKKKRKKIQEQNIQEIQDITTKTNKETNTRIIKYRGRRKRHSGQKILNKAIEENILNLNERLVKVKGAYRV